MPTNILLKIFARSFYRLHAGLFLFVFLILFGIIEPAQWYEWHKNLMIAFVSQPLLLFIGFGAWLVYAVKVLHHTITWLYADQQQFLFYSTTSLTTKRQFKSWFIVHLVMMLPIVIYGILSAFTSFYYHFFLQSFSILLYLGLLVLGMAYICLYIMNSLNQRRTPYFLLRLTGKWCKPIFSLYIYHVFHQLKTPLLVTKICSWLIILATFSLFARESADMRVAGICILTVTTAHAVLIYQEHLFEEAFMSFMRNMPFPRYRLFLNFIMVYFILLLPEGVWLFSRFSPVAAIRLYLLVLSFVLLFHVLVYKSGTNMARYLRWIFSLWFMLFFLLMFGLIWPVTLVSLAAAWLIYYVRYYRMA